MALDPAITEEGRGPDDLRPYIVTVEIDVRADSRPDAADAIDHLLSSRLSLPHEWPKRRFQILKVREA